MLADIEHELAHLRQARESFQSTVMREETKRNELLERISSKIKSSRHSATLATTVDYATPRSGGAASVLSAGHFDGAAAELSTRLGSAIKSLEHTLGSPTA